MCLRFLAGSTVVLLGGTVLLLGLLADPGVCYVRELPAAFTPDKKSPDTDRFAWENR